jgi:hypothetical protein
MFVSTALYLTEGWWYLTSPRTYRTDTAPDTRHPEVPHSRATGPCPPAVTSSPLYLAANPRADGHRLIPPRPDPELGDRRPISRRPDPDGSAATRATPPRIPRSAPPPPPPPSRSPRCPAPPSIFRRLQTRRRRRLPFSPRGKTTRRRRRPLDGAPKPEVSRRRPAPPRSRSRSQRPPAAPRRSRSPRPSPPPPRASFRRDPRLLAAATPPGLNPRPTTSGPSAHKFILE